RDVVALEGGERVVHRVHDEVAGRLVHLRGVEVVDDEGRADGERAALAAGLVTAPGGTATASPAAGRAARDRQRRRDGERSSDAHAPRCRTPHGVSFHEPRRRGWDRWMAAMYSLAEQVDEHQTRGGAPCWGTDCATCVPRGG